MSNFEDKYRGMHKRLSIIKSVIRLFGCGLAALFLGDLLLAFEIVIATFAIAELLGIAEEMI